MKVFMLGWEFPPFISGGLGTACYGLTRALDQLGHEVVFVLPQPVDNRSATHVQLKSPNDCRTSPAYQIHGLQHVEFHGIPSNLQPYISPGDFVQQAPAAETAVPNDPQSAGGMTGHYGGDLFTEVRRYTKIAAQMAIDEKFDVVHAHDWMTYPAGIAVSAISGKPLVVHVHSTEFDRSGELVNQRIYDIERMGIQNAEKVIAVSYFTRNIVLKRYAASAAKVEVVYNAIDRNGEHDALPPPIERDEKIVLFLGRITMQKGPEYFLAAARKVLEYEKNVRFIMAGSGDLIRRSIEMAAQMGIGRKVLFTGFLRGDDVARVYKMADLYVMPSVSEPFGIAPLEALSHDVPVLISKQSGVSEILTHVLKVDFWDIDEMANKIIAVLRHPPLRATLREHGQFEVRRLTWQGAARNCVEVYQKAIAALN